MIENRVIAKLNAEGLSLSSPWEEIEACLSRTEAPNRCIATARELIAKKARNSMNKHELLDNLMEAQQKIFEVIETLDNYVRMSGDTNAETYLVDHLKIMASRESGFISRDLNMDDLFDRIMGDQNEE